MKCIFKDNCFVEKYKEDISLLIGLVAKKSFYHSVTVENDSIFGNISFLKYEDLCILKLSFISEVTRSYNYQGETIIIDANGDQKYKDKVFTPSESIDYINEKLSIIVENSLYDGRFIKCIIRHFGNQRLIEALNANYIKVNMSGGCTNIINAIEAQLDGFMHKPKFLRCFVLWDSDNFYPPIDPIKVDTLSQSNIVFLNNLNIKYHILYKREMENYLPLEAVGELAKRDFVQWFNAFRYLTQTQRDFYDINRGFKYNGKHFDSSNRLTLPDGVKELYASVSDKNFNYLKDGLKIGNFKDKFSNAFETSVFINKASLLKHTDNQPNPNELQEIVDKINSLI